MLAGLRTASTSIVRFAKNWKRLSLAAKPRAALPQTSESLTSVLPNIRHESNVRK